MSKKKKIKLICIAAAFLCLVLAACYTVFLKPLLEKEKWIYKDEIVEKGTLTVGVTESGSLEYGITTQLYDLNLTVAEDSEEEDEDEEETTEKYLKVEEVYVAAGQRITEGEALLKFTEDSVRDVRSLLETAKTEAEIAYSEAQSEYNLSILSAELSYESDVVVSKYADKIYQYESQAIDNSISKLQVELETAKAETDTLAENYAEVLEDYEDAKEEYEAAKNLLDQIGENIYVEYQNKYLMAKSSFEQAENRLEQAKRSQEENVEKIAELEAQIAAEKEKKNINKMETEHTYEETILAAEVAGTTYEAELLALAETLAEAEEELEEATGQVEEFEAFVGEDGIVYASGSGIVTQVGYEEGDVLMGSGTVVSYAQAEDMTITVEVSQEDVVTLSVGDSVKIEFSAYEGELYEGKIAEMEITTTADGATVSYPVTISVLGDTSALYGGMTADVTFVTEEKEDVLYISRKAIVEENGKTYVYTDNVLGQKELTEVETGLSNGVSVEIVSGLSEGDIYYIASRVSEEAENAEENSSATESMEGLGIDMENLPEGMEGLEIDIENLPEDFEMPGGGSSTGGGMPGGGSGTGGGMPGGGSSTGGEMPGGGSSTGSGNSGQMGGRP